MNNKKRKDKKGRILKTGESQRKDFVYQYRYIDFHGKRQTVYASTLQELRQKEKEIQKQVDDGLDYEAGQITVIELIEKYISLKQGVRYNTKVGYQFVLNLVKKEEFGYRKISTIKVSDAKQWFMSFRKTAEVTVPLPACGELSNRHSRWHTMKTLLERILLRLS